MKDKKLYIVMVGLPARGKSTIAAKLKECLVKDSIKARIFNNGELRRKTIPTNTSFAEFFDPRNKEGMSIRENIALINIKKAQRFINNGGYVAILDATNASLKRRKLISRKLNDHPILFIECINDNDEILRSSKMTKVSTQEFIHLSKEEAYNAFNDRISYYQQIYTSPEKEKNYIKLDSLNNCIIKENIENSVPYYGQIRDFLVTDTLKNLYIIRHGETFFNLENRIGGDSDLTEKGLLQARSLANYFKRIRIPLIFTSTKKRAVQTAKPIMERQEKGTIISLPEFDEIDSGVCECMTYKEIKERMPNVYKQRKMDKYNYIYPNGEGYITMKKRIDQGLKKVLFLSQNATNIMIIGHQGVNRMILSHFLFRREEDVPYIYIPQDKYYYISSSQNRKVFQLKKYQ
jgi:broad specificity phosphatase PhoE/predicted kinase